MSRHFLEMTLFNLSGPYALLSLVFFMLITCLLQWYFSHFHCYYSEAQTPQSPIVRTSAYTSYGIDEFPTGTNAIVAVLAYTG